jgi:hypothetical protein
MIQNVVITYYSKDDEEDALVGLYNKAYKIALNNDGVTLMFINLTECLDTVTIDDLTYPIPYGSYSEYTDYTFEDLEEQIYYIYKEFYSKGILYEPVVIIIHDSAKLCEFNDEYQLITYLDEKVSLLEVMQVYVFCTINEN